MPDRPEWVRDRTSSLGPRYCPTWHFADVYDLYLKAVAKRFTSHALAATIAVTPMLRNAQKNGSVNLSITASRFVRHRLRGGGRKAQDGGDDIMDAHARDLIGRLVAGWRQGMRIRFLDGVAVFDALVDPFDHVREERIGRGAKQRIQAGDQDVALTTRRQRTEVNSEIVR